jgi:biopolymer transport protein ExbD
MQLAPLDLRGHSQMQFRDKPRRKPTINITSLIDVLFLLLTFFLVTTTFIEQSALKVELPSMQNADRVQQEKRFILNVSKDGQMVYNGEAIASESLKAILSKSSTDVDASGGLILRADEGLPYGEVMGILDLIKGSGVKRFIIATDEQGAP